MWRSILVAATLFVLSPVVPVAAQDATDHLGIPGPITVGSKDYALAWSSNPQPGYFKQEYLPAGAVAATYDSMVIVEFLATDSPISDVVAAQISMINQRKASDPVANFAVLKNDTSGEILLDFLLSSKDQNGEYVIEWNAYRYVEGTSDGKRGALLFALSERAYGNDAAKTFLQGLKDFKAARIRDLTSTRPPELR